MAHWIEREWEDSAAALDVADSEFVVATAAAADVEEYAPLTALLRRVRKAFGIEAAFVSDLHAKRETDTLQSLYGMRLLDAERTRGAFRFEAVPGVTERGGWRGTLCCRLPLPAADDAAHEEAARSVARLIANCFDETRAAA
jgi:hypothetical protein